MKLFKQLGYVAALLALFVAGNGMAQQAPVAGRDYTLINPPQPTDSGKKIEVIEFFWYGCPHCYHLEPSLNAWLKTQARGCGVPAGAGDVRRARVGTADAHLLCARCDGPWRASITRPYSLLSTRKRMRADKRALVNDSRAIADWLGSKGVDKQKFLDTYNSFAVNGRTKRSEEMTRNYDVSGTPALAIDGKYLVSPSSFVNADNSLNYDRFFNAVDQLIAQVRKERSRKK